jgi:hypothetical protein
MFLMILASLAIRERHMHGWHVNLIAILFYRIKAQAVKEYRKSYGVTSIGKVPRYERRHISDHSIPTLHYHSNIENHWKLVSRINLDALRK